MLLHLNLNQNNKVTFTEKCTKFNISKCNGDKTKIKDAVDAIQNKPCRWSKHDNVNETGDSYRTDMISWELELMKPPNDSKTITPPQKIPIPDSKRPSANYEDGTSSWGHFEFLENGLSHLGSLSMDNQFINHENPAFSRCGSIVSIDCLHNEDRNDFIFELEL
jgi:hypothetical protein